MGAKKWGHLMQRGKCPKTGFWGKMRDLGQKTGIGRHKKGEFWGEMQAFWAPEI